MKVNLKFLIVLTAAIALIAPILVGCNTVPAGDNKAGVSAGDIVVDGKRGGGSNAPKPAKGGGARPSADN